LDEHDRVGETPSDQFPGVDLNPILELAAAKAELIEAALLDEAVCDDPDDDKSFACAITGGASVIISGNEQLLKMSG
jgi:predicted nucleic acid-binding protein